MAKVTFLTLDVSVTKDGGCHLVKEVILALEREVILALERKVILALIREVIHALIREVILAFVKTMFFHQFCLHSLMLTFRGEPVLVFKVIIFQNHF